ncbi:hypothetical protein [Algoriphagus sp.]
MKNKKPVTPDVQGQMKSAADEAVKNLSDLGKTELTRKKKVDPGVE